MLVFIIISADLVVRTAEIQINSSYVTNKYIIVVIWVYFLAFVVRFLV